MQTVCNNGLRMVQGDDDAIKICLNGREFEQGDILTLTVRRKHGGVIFSKSVKPAPGTEAYIYIVAADTKCIQPGEYEYDLECKWEGRTVQTLVPCAVFEITKEVTR